VSTAVLSVGSNVGNRLGHLQAALEAFRPWLVAVSPVYETAPWGPVPQDDFLNLVLVVRDDGATPRQWLSRAQQAETAARRTRDVRWGPRTLDVDVVAVDDVHSDDPDLTLPHPRAAHRAFVLVPWLAADPSAQLSGRAVADLVDALPRADVDGVRLRSDQRVA
jgi:2-amino-4-hydroxy-6-hydroxymethyldihydropteridine diphosphokinase